MSKNIFLSGIYHETHTFLGEPTTLKDFIIFHDEEIINENTGNGSVSYTHLTLPTTLQV